MAHFVIRIDHENHNDNIEKMEEHYENQIDKLDAGLDLFIPYDITVPANARSFKINHHMQVGLYSTSYFDSIIFMCTGVTTRYAYMLCARSSTGSKTPLRLCNSIGIIDLAYTGDLIACVDNMSNEDFVIKTHDRLFQIVPLNGMQIKKCTINTNDSFDFEETKRGDAGFGSSDKLSDKLSTNNELYDKVVNEIKEINEIKEKNN